MAKKTTPGDAWLSAIAGQGLKVKTARDALSIQGWLHSGNYALNWAISGRFLRGYPLGHSVEVFGDPSTGKSFLITLALAHAQQAGGVAMLDDVEGAYNLDWIDSLGVDADSLAYRRSRTVKDHLETTLNFINAYKDVREKGGILGPGVLACDSLSLLTTEHELTVGLDKPDMSKAKELKAFFRIVGGDLADLPVVHISASHTIAQIGMFGRTTSGGGGPKFQASTRLDLRATSKIKSGTEVIGVITRVVAAKTRATSPYKEVRLAIPFHRPISPMSGLIPALLELGILKLDGQWLTLDGERLGIRGYVAKDSFLKQDQAADELMLQLPGLLEEVDKILDARGEPGGDVWGDPQILPADGAPPTEDDDPEEINDS